VKVKDDYKDSDWLKRQYYELGRSVQDIATEQGVSMITIRKWIDISEEDKQKTIKIQTVKSHRKSSGMKSEYKLALGIIFGFLIISGGYLGGGIIQALFGVSVETFWIGLGVGSLLGLVAFLLLLEFLDLIELNPLYWGSPPKPKDYFWSQGNKNIEKVESVEEKDDYKNLDWLRQQYYELGRTIQDIAEGQGVSMITIRKWLDKHKPCPHCGSFFSANLKYCGKCGDLLNN